MCHFSIVEHIAQVAFLLPNTSLPLIGSLDTLEYKHSEFGQLPGGGGTLYPIPFRMEELIFLKKKLKQKTLCLISIKLDIFN